MIRKAQVRDKSRIVDLFCNNIREQRSYISHGEIQMGIALDTNMLADDYVDRWKNYLDFQMNQFGDYVLVYLCDEKIEGFVIGITDRDMADLFGVVCDLVVSSEKRAMGIGSKLLDELINLFETKGITDLYLESGINNHEAHDFFEKKGFEKISSVFRLNRNK